MPIVYDRLIARQIPDVVQSYGARDVALYALGLGLGLDPEDCVHPTYVMGEKPSVLPTMATVLAQERSWFLQPDVGANVARSVHGEHRLLVHHPLLPRARVIGKTRVTDLKDKGAGRGAIIVTTTDLFDQDTQIHYASSIQSVFFREDGGFGGPSGAVRIPYSLPVRAPDASVLQPTSPQTALIYRLSGDENPLHSDPAFARSVGFERPILHGLAVFGISAYAAMRTYFPDDPWSMRSVECRFTAPALPGDTMRVDLWHDERAISFRTVAVERNVTVAGYGLVML
jgi:acyl dehydratase